MTELDQYLMSEGGSRFREAKRLTDTQSNSDPETEPYKSLYEARQIWAELKANIERFESDELLFKARRSAIHYFIGVNFTDCDEISSGEEHLLKSIELIESHGLNELTCNVLQNAYNYMGILWSNRQASDKALDYLEKSEKLYQDYKHEVGSPPFCIDEVLDSWSEEEKVQKRMTAFESAFTKTTYYLAQVCTALGRNDDAAHYCQTTLKRQLDTSYDPIEWAMNCATLSQYHVGTNYPASRHCLASASLIISQAEGDSEKLMRSRADVNRCWGKYALNLLESSKMKLFESLDEELKPESEVEPPLVDRFNLECDRYEANITDKYLLVFSDARPVFLYGQKCLHESLKFYSLDGYCTDHVEIQQDISKLFKGLLFFEEDIERQCKMQKRRIDLLSPLLEELNSQYYLLLCRQLMFDIAQIYSDMVDLKLALIEQKATLRNVQQAKKLNHLVRESVSYYDKYSTSFKNPDGKIPDKCEETDMRPLMIAKFCTARLYSKFIVTKTEDRIRNLEESIVRYQAVVDYCERHEGAARLVTAEVDLCKEMVQLLPLRIEKSRDVLDAKEDMHDWSLCQWIWPGIVADLVSRMPFLNSPPKQQCTML